MILSKASCLAFLIHWPRALPDGGVPESAKGSFEIAAEEIDSLSLEGYFGKDAKELVGQRNLMGTPDFLSLCLERWIAAQDQFGKGKVIQLISLFLRIYAESIKKNGQFAVDCLTYFYRGFPESPEAECLSSFLELLPSFQEIHTTLGRVLQGERATNELRSALGRQISGTYQKSVEFINKMLTILLLLLDMPKDLSKAALTTYTKPLAWKTRRFLEVSKGRYDEIVSQIDSEIRNAESHVDMTFSPSRASFIYKVRKKGRTERREIQAIDLFFKLLALGAVIQAFIYSGSLLVLAGTKPDSYREISERLRHTS